MPIRRLAVIAAGVAAVTAVFGQTTRPDDTGAVDRARALLKLLVGGQYDEFVKAGDSTVQAKLAPAQVAQIWGMLRFQHGAYEAEESAKATSVGQYCSVQFALRFQRARQHLRIVLDQQGRLAGFWLDRAEPLGGYPPPDYADPSRFREEKVTVSSGEFALPGTLTIPVGAGPHPAVVLVHGSGPQDEDETVGAHKPFRDLAWGLGSRGIAVLRYQKRTQAYPQAKQPEEWTLADEVIDDAVAAVRLLRARPEIDAKRVYVAGHSQGGLAAPYIAQRDKELAGLIILAGSARSVLDLIDEQTGYLAKLDGQVSPEEQQELDKIRRLTAAIRAGRLEEAPTDAGFPIRPLAELHRLEPAKEAAKLRVPMLIIQGGRDYQVTRADFELWRKHLVGRPDVRFVLFEDLNHLFSVGTGAATPAEYEQPGHVDVRVVGAIVEWVGAGAGP